MRRTLACLLLLFAGTAIAQQVPGTVRVVEVENAPTIGGYCDPRKYSDSITQVRTTGDSYYCDETSSIWVYLPVGTVSLPWIDPTTPPFGAIANDGLADDAALALACAALPADGGIIRFPAGTFAFASTGINCGTKPVTIEGTGPPGGTYNKGGTSLDAIAAGVIVIKGGDYGTTPAKMPRGLIVRELSIRDATSGRTAGGAIRLRLMTYVSIENVSISGFRNAGVALSLEGSPTQWLDWVGIRSLWMYDNKTGVRLVDRVSDLVWVSGSNQAPRAVCSHDATVTCDTDPFCAGLSGGATCNADCAAIGLADLQSGTCSVTTARSCMYDADCPVTETCNGDGVVSTNAGGRIQLIGINFNDWGSSLGAISLGATRFFRTSGIVIENNGESQSSQDCTTATGINIDSPGGGIYGQDHRIRDLLCQKIDRCIVADADTSLNSATGILCQVMSGACLTDASDTFDVVASPYVDSKVTRDFYLTHDADLRLDEGSTLWVGTDVTVARSAVAELTTNSGLWFGVGSPTDDDKAEIAGTGRITRYGNSASADTFLQSYVSTAGVPEAVARWLCTVDGRCQWSDGVTFDTELLRIGANVLGTSDDFQVGSNSSSGDSAIRFNDDDTSPLPELKYLHGNELFQLDSGLGLVSATIPTFSLDSTATTPVDFGFAIVASDATPASEDNFVQFNLIQAGGAPRTAHELGYDASGVSQRKMYDILLNGPSSAVMTERYVGNEVTWQNAGTRFNFLNNVKISVDGGYLAIDAFTITDNGTELTVTGGNWQVSAGGYNTGHLVITPNHVWSHAGGRLRVLGSNPAADGDGAAIVTDTSTDVLTNKTIDGDDTGNAIMIPDGASGAATATENIAIDDTNQGQFTLWDGGTAAVRHMNVELEHCDSHLSLVAADDDVPLQFWRWPQKVLAFACCDTDGAVTGQLILEDHAGAVISGTVNCSDCASAITYTDVSADADGTLDANEGLRFDTVTGVTAATRVEICYTWRARAQL